MVNVAKIGQAAKFLFNRMCGVKYGGVKFQNGPVQLVKSKHLSRLIDTMENKLGSDYLTHMSRKEFDSIMNLTKPLQKGSNIVTTGDNLTFLSAHGGVQIWDRQAGKSIMDICETLRNPVKTYFKG